jgi:hypothetical protein
MKKALDPAIVARIVGDYRAGMSSIAVGDKWGVSSTSVLRYARDAGVIRSHAKARDAARGRRERAAARAHEAEVALTGGRWVRVGLIHKWEAA